LKLLVNPIFNISNKVKNMQPGPTLIKKCPHCLTLIKQDTTGSGNTFGATYWTDGKIEAPMLPEHFELVLCSHCEEPIWIDELDVIAKIDRSTVVADDFKEADYCTEPFFGQYIKIIESQKLNFEKEKYIRIRSWWDKNDRRRRVPRVSPQEAANLEALADMLGEVDAQDLIMKAELMRELGRYSEALLLLNKIKDDNFLESVEIIKLLCERRDPFVRDFEFLNKWTKS
jgi:hypothetical protein